MANLVEFSGSHRGVSYSHAVAELVKGPTHGQKGLQITLNGQGYEGVPQTVFRVILDSDTSYRMLREEGGAIMTGKKPQESDDQIAERINRRFRALDTMANATISGVNTALIVSGPAGLGKSFSIDRAVKEAEVTMNLKYQTIKGFVRATGLYKALYEMRELGSVTVFDDADSILLDDVTLNLLKAALDTTDERWLSWRAETRMESEDGEILPRSFLFEGQVIFISNLDFEGMIDKGSKLAPHLEALLSRSHYLDLDIRTPREYLVRIREVCKGGMLRKRGLNTEQEAEVLHFMEANVDSLRELSLRMALKLAAMLKMDPKGWQGLAEMTVLKRRGR